MRKTFVILAAAIALSGCANSGHVIKNYKEIIRLSDGKQLVLRQKKSNLSKANRLIEHTKNNILLHTLKTTPIPMRTHPKILRVFVLPWTDTAGILHMQQYSYIVVKHGQWVMGQYLTGNHQFAQRVFTPLTKEDKIVR